MTDLFWFIVHQLQTNTLLVGGIGTVVFGSFMYLLKSVPLAVFNMLKRLITIELTINSETNTSFGEIANILSVNNVRAFDRLFTLGHRGKIVAGYGTSYAFWKRRLIVYNRSIMKSEFRVIDKIEMTLFSRRVELFNDLIEESRKPSVEPSIRVWTSWDSVKKKKRLLPSIFCNDNIDLEIKNGINKFLDSESWYAKRGISYKLVILLHGKPGCGKSSLIFSLASEFNRDLWTISNLSQIEEKFGRAPKNSFVVIEDIDMILDANREDKAEGTPEESGNEKAKKKSDKYILHDLINTLDGLATPHGLILFITTNYKERLDPALIRKGRIDLDYDIGPLNQNASGRMFKAFYGDDSYGIVVPYLNGREFQPRTGAELQSIFMEEANPHAAVTKMMGGPHLIQFDRSSDV